MNKDAEERMKNKKRAATAKKTNGEVDYSLMSFNFTFSPSYPPKNPVKDLEMTFRFQTFGELRQWGQIISPNSNIHPGDRMETLLESLQGCLLSPSAEIFETWFCQVNELDMEDFIKAYGDAKGAKQKK